MLPLMGYEDYIIEFTPVDDKVTEDEVKVAQGLRELGMNDEGIKSHLENAGFEFRDGVEIKQPEKVQGFGSKELGEYKSRKTDNDMSDRKTGSESSTRDEQVGLKSKFSDYPYTMK